MVEKLSDKMLLESIKSLVSEERGIVLQILMHLKEIEARRLFSDLKYPSLFEYAIQELKYSAGQAHRRIQAMRFLRDHPAIEADLRSGGVTISHIALVQKCDGDKLSKLQEIKGLSTREAEKQLGIQKSLSLNQIGDPELKEKLLRLLKPAESLEDLLNRLADDALLLAAPKVKRRREVFARDKHCTNCGSTYSLEIDHVHPAALGGNNDSKNLRLLCRTCNQRMAIKAFGLPKMQRYLSKPFKSGFVET